jgi:hypothetical protein
VLDWWVSAVSGTGEPSPSISFYFLVGSIDPKVSIRLNSITCWSEKANFIEFDDGSKICLKFEKKITR